MQAKVIRLLTALILLPAVVFADATALPAAVGGVITVNENITLSTTSSKTGLMAVSALGFVVLSVKKRED